MDGERKFVVVTVAVSAICITILYVFLFVSLWRYKEVVGLSLLAVLILVTLVFLLGKLNEQHLRRVRYQHHQEIPLDFVGEPHYWPQDAQENPYHASFPVRQSLPHAWSEGYQQEH